MQLPSAFRFIIASHVRGPYLARWRVNERVACLSRVEGL
jgi:hypothetical protein